MMRALFCSVLAVMLALPRLAFGVQTYPEEIKAHLGLNASPPCTLCHATNEGGLGTVVTPFGKSMMAEGLSTNFGSLDTALDRLATDNVDSNGDGTSDIDQLKNNTDPNTGAPYTNTEPQQYGCGARVATHPTARNGSVVLFLGLAFASHVRRRHKAAHRRSSPSRQRGSVKY
jgi:hypothetical protein